MAKKYKFLVQYINLGHLIQHIPFLFKFRLYDDNLNSSKHINIEALSLLYINVVNIYYWCIRQNYRHKKRDDNVRFTNSNHNTLIMEVIFFCHFPYALITNILYYLFIRKKKLRRTFYVSLYMAGSLHSNRVMFTQCNFHNYFDPTYIF